MTKIYRQYKSIAIILTFLTLISCISKKSEEQPKTIVELNHFYSDTTNKANYNITGIIQGRPLIFLLK